MSRKTLLILHGIMGYAGENWTGWLKDEAGKLRYKVLMPNLPNAGHPDRQEWLDTIRLTLKDVDHSELVIVGHSLGVTSALDYIELANENIKGLVSVSGFYQDTGAELNSYFMVKRDVEIEKVRDRVKKKYVLYGDDDPYLTQELLSNVAEGLGVKPMIFKDGGHLNEAAGYTEFPELVGVLKEI